MYFSPKFQKLLQMLGRGQLKGIVVLCWGRISRNKGDDTIIRKLMRKGVDVRFVYAKYEKTSSGALHMDIDGMFSQHHSRVTSEKVKITTKNARAKGVCTYRAPIGYLNLGQMGHKPLDPERAPIIKEMYELYAQGGWSLSDLARHANEQGMTTVPMRPRRSKEEILADEGDDMQPLEKVSRPIQVNHVSRILSNPFYTGKILDTDGTYIESVSHEALVDDELFNRVQQELKKNKVSVHYTEKLDLPLRGKVRCTHCNRVYTPYMKKGILYYNARCKKDCPNKFKNCNFAFVAEKVEEKLQNLYFTDNELAEMDARVGTEVALLEEKRQKELDQLERKKKHLREEVKYLRTNKLKLLQTGAYSPEEYINEENRLNEELKKLRESEGVSDEAMHETMKDIVKLSELVKNIVPLYNFANQQEEAKIINTIFSELYIFDKVLEYKAHEGFECLEHRFDAVCDPSRIRLRTSEPEVVTQTTTPPLKFSFLQNLLKGKDEKEIEKAENSLLQFIKVIWEIAVRVWREDSDRGG